ncbi:RNA polymerase sigma factor [Jatrophihabitans sp. YIM 134969]
MGDRDETWFAALYRAHHGDVLRYARRRVPGHEVDDVVAEVFTTAWRRRHEVDRLDRLWLLAAAHHHVQHAARSGARRERVTAALPSPGVVREAPDAVLDVVAALTRLSPDDRELLTLVAWEELTPAEAAQVLGVPAATVRVRLLRARRRLAALLDPEPQATVVPEGTS